ETDKFGTDRFTFDATNMLTYGVNEKGDSSTYVYNGLQMRVERNHLYHSGSTDDRDYVVDLNSSTRRDLMVYADEWFTQNYVYANGQFVEQVTDTAPNQNGNGGLERLLYVHESIMGSVHYMTKENGNSFAELEYDVYGAPISPDKLVNNDNGVFIRAQFTNHTYDFVLDIYHAQYRFYDAENRTFMSVDPVKDGLNWYNYVGANPATFVDPLGLHPAGQAGREAAKKYEPQEKEMRSVEELIRNIGGSATTAAGGLARNIQPASDTFFKPISCDFTAFGDAYKYFWERSDFFAGDRWWLNSGKVTFAGIMLQAEAILTGGVSLIGVWNEKDYNKNLALQRLSMVKNSEMGATNWSGTASGLRFMLHKMGYNDYDDVWQVELTAGQIAFMMNWYTNHSLPENETRILKDHVDPAMDALVIGAVGYATSTPRKNTPMNQGQGAETTKQKLEKIAKQADQNVAGSGTVPGTLKHSDFAKQVNSLKDSNLKTEVSYLNGQVVKYGTKGSVRLDVVEYGSKGEIISVYDLKTGTAGLTQSRITEIQSHIPNGSQVPVVEIRP
ncbi:hypothetical protein LJC27_07065, partial [Christensenellaceae bacterium OttesenSCG-928-M15]|nr:hypothetical protein [Christensenellaceae bacterium OttesenSCG-928-M15]